MEKRNEALKDNREYFIDNLKAFLIVLVIFGHVATCLQYRKENSGLYYFIYIFHMPCFAFTSGYMAKSIVKNGKFRADRYFSTLWLYAFFRTATCLIERAYGRDTELKLFDVSGAPWYLLALSAWYLMVPLLLSLKPYVGIIITTFAGLLIGYADDVDTYLSLSRTLVFLPFFAIGLYLSRESLEAFLSKKLRIPAFLLLAVTAGYFVFVGNPISGFSKIVYGGTPYSSALGSLAPYGFFIRGGLYLAAVVLSAACMLLIPRRRTWFSYVGKYSLAVYILHVFVRDIMKWSGIFRRLKKLPSKYMLLAFPLCVIAALVLGNPLFGRAMNWIANPFREFKRTNFWISRHPKGERAEEK